MDQHTMVEQADNPYWERVSAIAQKQRDKGIATYGQGIEKNPADIIKRIEYLQEELVDALMYCEWIKDSVAKDTNVPSWIPVTERLPDNFVSVLGYMTDAGEFPPVRECYTVGNAFFFPALGDIHPVSHWCEMPKLTKEVDHG